MLAKHCLNWRECGCGHRHQNERSIDRSKEWHLCCCFNGAHAMELQRNERNANNSCEIATRRRSIIEWPSGVLKPIGNWHAFENVGNVEPTHCNFPSKRQFSSNHFLIAGLHRDSLIKYHPKNITAYWWRHIAPTEPTSNSQNARILLRFIKTRKSLPVRWETFTARVLLEFNMHFVAIKCCCDHVDYSQSNPWRNFISGVDYEKKFSRDPSSIQWKTCWRNINERLRE